MAAIDVEAVAAVSFAGSALFDRGVLFAASPSISITASSNPLRNPGFAAIVAVSFASVIPLPKSIPVRSTAEVNFATSGSFSRSVPIAATAEIVFASKNCMDRGRDAIGVCEVVADILHLWGFTNPHTAPGYAIKRALTDLNAALQIVWNQADVRDYWVKQTLTISLLANATSSNLPDDVQNITGLCRLSSTRRTLVPCGTLGELENFMDFYLDGETVTEPVAYHVQRLNQVANDPARCIFHVTPAPLVNTDILVDAVKESPRYGIRDVTNCPRIPIPHRYVESILLPVVRKRATSYYLFTAQDKLEAIDQEYAQARISLGMGDPLPGNAGDNFNKRKEESA